MARPEAALGDLTSAQEEWLIRARRDFRFFCAHLKIRIKDESTIIADDESRTNIAPFIWRPAQYIVWLWMCDQMRRGVPIRMIILKARQFGISTFFCAWLFWQMWRQMHVRCLVSVKAKGTTMRAFSQTMNLFYTSLPEGFRPSLRSPGGKRLSAEEIYFDDRQSGGYYVAADIPDSARGDAYDHALCTEVGSYTRAKDFFGEFSPAMGNRPNTTRILESTAAPGYFREKYLTAKPLGQGKFLPWSAAPEMYSRRLLVDHHGRRKIYKDFETEEIIAFSKEDHREMEFLSREHERINAEIGQDVLQPVTLEQMNWWHWFCNTEYDGDEEWMRQEFPRDDKSAFEKSVISAFKMCLPVARVSIESAAEPDAGILECTDDITDVSIDQHDIKFYETAHKGTGWQERLPGIEIYEHPIAGYVYTIGVDVADDIGTVQDEDDAAFSVISVFCCNTRKQVAEWRGSIDPHLLGDEVAKVGYYYNTAMICVEYNNMGITCIDRLTKYIEYPNRFKYPIPDEAGRLHPRKEMWWTNERNKNEMIGSFRSAVRTGSYIVLSAGLYEEMMGYQNYDGNYEPGPGCFADRIIAASLSWQCVSSQNDPEMMMLVFGSKYADQPAPKPQLSADGQARKFIERSGRSPLEVPPKMLPLEFRKSGDEEVQEVQSNWIFDAATKEFL